MAIDVIVGAVFRTTGVVTRKLLVALCPCRSVTVSVTVELPLMLATGPTVTNRLEPLPVKPMLAAGRNVPLDVAAVTTRNPGNVCLAPTVKARGPADPPTVTV